MRDEDGKRAQDMYKSEMDRHLWTLPLKKIGRFRAWSIRQAHRLWSVLRSSKPPRR